jgi:hypothetical protein
MGARGGKASAAKRIRVMPSDTPTPDWSDVKALLAYLEDRGGRQERGELDGRVIPYEAVKVAKGLLELKILERLDGIEALLAKALSGRDT